MEMNSCGKKMNDYNLKLFDLLTKMAYSMGFYCERKEIHSGSVLGHLIITLQRVNTIVTSSSSFLMAAFQNISLPER
jgi:hypothetical protein